MIVSPENCSDMSELRHAIDMLDRDLVGLLAKRARFIDRAAEIKAGNGLPARIDDRVEQVVTNARTNAERTGFDPDLAENLWRCLIDWSIAREQIVLDRTELDKRVKPCLQK